MGGSFFGRIFTVMTFGESHGPAVGCVVDGCPAGLALDAETIAVELRRRRPGGGGAAATTRQEADEPELLSGVFEGKTLGTPIAILIRNTAQRSSDYEALRDIYRPGHADWTWEAKYGVRDHRGGGRSSGRETAGRVAAGAVAKAFLATQGISIQAWSSAIAGVPVPGPEDPAFDGEEAERNPLRVPHRACAEEIGRVLEKIREGGDSAGGTVRCVVRGLPPGLGEPVFDKLDALLAAALLSLGAAKGIEFGAGFAAAEGRGSDQNDRPLPSKTSEPGILPDPLPPGVPDLEWKTNHSGGMLGGLSTGMDLDFRVAFKPVPSIAQTQETVDRTGNIRSLRITGRHDLCIVPRAVPVVEAMTALVLADLLLLHRAVRL